METSQDTAPAGSKYLACDRNSRTVLPPRVTVRSVLRPPGWRCPPVPTSVVSRVTFHSCAGPILFRAAPRAMSGNVYLPFLPVPLIALKTGYDLIPATSIHIGRIGVIDGAADVLSGTKSMS